MAIFTVLSFSLSFVLARRLEKHFTPIFQNTVRSLVGLITFFTIALAFGILLELFLLPIILIILLMLSILFNVIFGDTAYLHSQKILGPAKALAIANISPFFTFLFAAMFLSRPITIQMILSGILIGIGVIVITKRKENNKIGDTVNSTIQPNRNEYKSNNEDSISTIKIAKGLLWALFASISWAIGFALSDYSFNRVNQVLGLGILSTILAMVVRFLFASVLLSSIAFIENRNKSFKPLTRSRSTWVVLILSALLSYSLGSIFFGEAVHVAGASFMSLISTAMPLFTIPFSYFINKETLSKESLIGVIITILGVVLIVF
ncbi:MAG: DMT family transporter [Candidatus Thorarchaeota archaeon]